MPPFTGNTITASMRTPINGNTRATPRPDNGS
ncbi:hypothetical protein YPPY06_3694, partial [Yersinia pestis PY-06]